MNREEFTAVFTAHYPAVLAYGLRRVGAEVAREMAAEVFTIAWRRRSHVPDPALPWLLATARRVLANEFRRGSRAKRLMARLQESAAAGSGAMPVSVPDHAHAVAESSALHAALDALSAGDREVLRLVAWEGLSPDELAVALGCSLGAGRVRLHRARARLRSALQDEPRVPEALSPSMPAGPAPVSGPRFSRARTSASTTSTEPFPGREMP